MLAQRTLWLLIVFPTAFFFNCIYTESLTLLTFVAFFYCLQRNRWYLAMMWGFLSTATHDINILLTFVGLAYLWHHRKTLPPSTLLIRFFSLAIIPLSLLLYIVFIGFLYNH